MTRRGRIAKIKRGDQSGSHSLILGATGAGKTTVLSLMASEYARSGHGVVLVEAKTDPDLEAEARRAAAAAGRPFVLVSPDGPIVWDLLATGGVDETVAKLLACEVYTEPHFKSEAVRLLRWVVRAMKGCDTPMTLPEILRLCAPDRLAAHASKHGSPELARQVEEFVKSLTAQERADVAGLRSRLAVLAESDYGRQLARPGLGRRAGARPERGDSPARRRLLPARLRAPRRGRREGGRLDRDRARSDRLRAPGPADPDLHRHRRVRGDRERADRWALHPRPRRRLQRRGRDPHARRLASRRGGRRGSG